MWSQRPFEAGMNNLFSGAGHDSSLIFIYILFIDQPPSPKHLFEQVRHYWLLANCNRWMSDWLADWSVGWFVDWMVVGFFVTLNNVDHVWFSCREKIVRSWRSERKLSGVVGIHAHHPDCHRLRTWTRRERHSSMEGGWRGEKGRVLKNTNKI